MAERIDFHPAERNVKEELYHQLAAAPQQHVEALLDLFAIAQLLRDKGIFELIKDTLGSGEKVLEIFTETLETDEVVRTVRNLSIFIKLIGSIEPETLERIMKAFSLDVETSKSRKPPGLLQLLRQLSAPESRRALEPALSALRSAGRSIPQPKKERPKTTRHRA
jgi:uncharacterized protein YjgD (DUF1641 family)